MKTPILHVHCTKKLSLELKPCRGKNSRGIQGAEVEVMGPYEAPRVLLDVGLPGSTLKQSMRVATEHGHHAIFSFSWQVNLGSAPEAND